MRSIVIQALRFSILVAVVAAALILPAHADELQISNPNQVEFKRVARDITAAYDYRSYGADVSFSQPLPLLTPYVGVSCR